MVNSSVQLTNDQRYSIELDEQSYQEILKLTISNMEDMSGLRKIIIQTLEAHPGWDELDGRQSCSGSACDWVKGRNHTRDTAFLRHQTYQLFQAIKAAGFRRVFDMEATA